MSKNRFTLSCGCVVKITEFNTVRLLHDVCQAQDWCGFNQNAEISALVGDKVVVFDEEEYKYEIVETPILKE